MDGDRVLGQGLAGTGSLPARRNCTCCSGFMNTCDCVKSKGARRCMKCEEATSPRTRPPRPPHSPEYDTSSDQGRFARAVEASASALESQAAPSLARTPSVTSTENIFNFSVKIFPPPPDVLSRDMFNMLILPGVIGGMCNGPGGESLTWPDRGWRNQTEFSTEVEAALQKRMCHIEGIVIARAQTLEEATKLSEVVNTLEVRACVVASGNPDLVSTSIMPPARMMPANTNVFVPSHTTIPGLEPSYSPEAKRHHVVLYLPSEAGEPGSPACAEYTNRWYDDTMIGHFTRILGADDPERGSSDRFTWPERGWSSAVQFENHTKESLRQHGHCIFARKLNYRDAMVLHDRLKSLRVSSSVIMSLSITAGVATLPRCYCQNGHDMAPQPAPAPSVLGTIRCSSCNDSFSGGEHRMRCEPCVYDLCTTCVHTTSLVPCQVIFGRSVGSLMAYPPCAAGDAVAPRADGRGHDLMSVLQEAVANGAAGGESGAGRNSGAMLNALAQLLGGRRNAKPATKQSFIDQLEHRTVGLHNFDDCKEQSCVICMGDFEEGEVVTSLPCGHWFHSGKPTRTSDDCCPGIIPWLKSNNNCPYCRKELEAETPAASGLGGSGGFGLTGPWNCPGCRRELTSYECDLCGIRRNVIAAANVTAAPLFDMIDALFFALLSFHNRMSRGDTGALFNQLDALSTSIDSLLNSQEMQSVTAANWAIRDAVEHLLKSAFRGERNFFFFQSSWMDSGSRALYALLVDRLTGKLQQREASDGEMWTIERPVLVPVPEPANWECPLCQQSHDSATQTCPCGVDRKVVRLASLNSDETARVFAEAEDLFFRSLDICVGLLEGQTKQAALNGIRRDTAIFLRSTEVQTLEDRGWKLRSQFASFLNAIQNGKRNVPFERDFVDTNSIALYACFLRRVVMKMAARSQHHPEYLTVTIGLPSRDEVTVEMNYEDLTTQQYFVHPNTEGFLRHHKKIFLLIARLIAVGSGPQSWEAITDVVLPQFARGGWMIANAVGLMRRGMRDLQTLAGDLDAGSQAVIEAILRKVIVLEQAAAEDSKESDENDMPPVPVATMQRQASVGTESRNVMQSLQSRLCAEEFKRVLLFLLKTLKHISHDQGNINYRRLKKDAPLIAELVLPNDEVMCVLTAVGFVVEQDVIFLRSVNRDSIVRAFAVISELAREISIDVL